MIKVSLNNIPLQVNTNGVRPGQLSIIDDSKPWLAREQILGARFADDAQTFEVVSLSGKRHIISYTTGSPVIPTNNDAALNQIYTKYMQTAYDISGEGLKKTHAQTFYSIYQTTQMAWATKAKLLAQINDPDISYTTRQGLIAQYTAATISLMSNTMQLYLYDTTIAVFFAEGNSCQFTDWVISDHTDFQFSLISRTAI